MRRALVLALLVAGCAHRNLAGTDIPETTDTKQLFDMVVTIGDAFEKRNADEVLKLVSSNYFEDNGTSQQEDDYGYAELKDKILPQSMAVTKETHLEMIVQAIV